MVKESSKDAIFLSVTVLCFAIGFQEYLGGKDILRDILVAGKNDKNK